MAEVMVSCMLVQYAVVNHRGRVRGNNEDNFYLDGRFMEHEHLDEGASIAGHSRTGNGLYAVCDGMGGIDAGEEASFRAVRMLAEKRDGFRLPEMTDPGTLTAQLQDISDCIYEEAKARRQTSGTTLAMAVIRGGRITIANVGDSRIYRYRAGELKQISTDHSKVQRKIAMGLLTPKQAKTDPERHVISQYLGMPKEYRLAPCIVADQEMQAGDIYLLCSDGLTDMVEDGQIRGILEKGCTQPGRQEDTGAIPEKLAADLADAALENGGRDNVTVMVLCIVPRGEEHIPAAEQDGQEASGEEEGRFAGTCEEESRSAGTGNEEGRFAGTDKEESCFAEPDVGKSPGEYRAGGIWRFISGIFSGKRDH